MSKLQVAILCGGQSAEHEVSIQSAKNVINALDSNRYDKLVIFITRQGEWFLFDSASSFTSTDKPQTLLSSHCQKVALHFGNGKALITLGGESRYIAVDAAFPVLHGAHGEDGTMQGLLELANIPYVGPGVLGSAVCMDKEVTKRLLQAANIPIANWICTTRDQSAHLNFDQLAAQMGLPFFIKPANTGSSVGISKVKTREDFLRSVDLALQYDHKIIIEEYIAGREIECSVLGNETPEASLPGEIIPHHEFYTYEAKYLDPEGASLEVPAKLSPTLIADIQTMAKKAFTTLCCEGMARVDFFVTPENRIFLNEANTIPGFTQISMYPKLWMVSGLSYSGLLDKLIALALARFQRDRVLVDKPNKQST